MSLYYTKSIRIVSIFLLTLFSLTRFLQSNVFADHFLSSYAHLFVFPFAWSEQMQAFDFMHTFITSFADGSSSNYLDCKSCSWRVGLAFFERSPYQSILPFHFCFILSLLNQLVGIYFSYLFRI